VLSLLQFLKYFGKISNSFELQRFQTHCAKAIAKEKKEILKLFAPDVIDFGLVIFFFVVVVLLQIDCNRYSCD
jgi:hypothetical protein